MANVLKAEHLSFCYPKAVSPVLNDISFSVEAGTSAAVVGPNGCGKTTLLNVLSGLYSPRSGVVTLSDRPIDSVKDSIAFVGAEFELFDYLTAQENSQFVNRFLDREWSCSEYQLSAERYGLNSVEQERAGSLSHGTRKKIQIVAAWMTKPRLLIADEPLDALDESSIESWTEDCTSFIAGGGIVISALHDEAFVSAHCGLRVDLGLLGLATGV